MAKSEKPKQLDLFVTLIGDVPLRDDREGMSVPLVSLTKNKRTEPIEWRSSDGDRYVRVTANATHGMATIWDWDVLIWAVSQLNEAMETGKPPSPALHFQPYNMLKAIGRGTSGKHYQELEAALNRLAGTLVETNIRSIGRRRASSFHLLERWDHDTDEETGRSLGLTLILPTWLFEGVVKHRDVLAVVPEYFDLSSGIARWLYRLVRRHAGKQAVGWRFTMKNLHERSGSTRVLKDFAKGVRKVVEEQGVPEYRLELMVSETGEEVVSMVRNPAKARPSRRRDMARIELPSSGRSGDGLVGSRPARHVGSRPKTRGITPQKRAQNADSKR